MDVHIRTLTDLDEALALAPLLESWLAESPETFSDLESFQGVIERLLKRHFEATETLLLFVSDPENKPVAACLIGPFDDPLFAERSPMVHLLHVEPDYRHRGLARHLIQDATAILTERKLDHLCLRAGHNDDAIISMGERWGFTRRWELMVRDEY